MPRPTINAKKCNVCGSCVEICPLTVFRKTPSKILIINANDCIGCRACEAKCSTGALKVKD